MRKSKIAITALLTIVVVLFITRLCVLDVLRVPSESACPKAGQMALVERWAYGYRLPWKPTSRLAYAKPGKGDWVAYNHPTLQRGEEPDTAAVCVGSIAATPGDTLWYNNETGRIAVRRDRAHGYRHPLVVPARGARIAITNENIRFYYITIMRHEPVKASIVDEALCVSGKMVKHYVFQHDYYWIVDAQSHLPDSHTFGFVPHVSLLGKIL